MQSRALNGSRIQRADRFGGSLRSTRSVTPFCSGAARTRQTAVNAAEPQAAKEAKAAGRMTYRPESYAELVKDATNSVIAAIEDGITLMEVEFPAVPANIDGECGCVEGHAETSTQCPDCMR